MTERSAPESLARVLAVTGLAFPRGVLGEETALLARALNGDGRATADLDAIVTDAARTLWPDLQPSTRAALERHMRLDGLDDDPDAQRVMRWAEDANPDDNPLARALCVRAAQELAGAIERAGRILENAEGAIAAGDAAGAIAAANAAGAIVVELLDLDPDDFADEIMAYVEADESPEALDTLARNTGDEETRAWARGALSAIALPGDAPQATAAVAALTDGDPPLDPAEDAVWVPTMLALVAQGFERALSSGG